MTLRSHLAKYENIDPEFVNTVVRTLYVDDFVSEKNSVKGCFELYWKLTSRFIEEGFNMRKLALNNQELNELIRKEEATLSSTPERSSKATPTLTNSNGVEDDDHSNSTLNNAVTEETLIKLMEVPWDGIEDSLKFDFTTFSRQANKAETVEHYILIL